MKSPKLFNIFENAVAQYNGLQNTQFLKDFVNHWKNAKIKGQYIIKPDDFNILLSKGVAYDTFRDEILNNPKEQYPNTTSAGRLYNLYYNLKERTTDATLPPAKRKYYKDVKDEFTSLVKNAQQTLSPEPQKMVNQVPVQNVSPTGSGNNKVQVKLPSINDTKYLKTRNVVIYGTQKYTIDDNMLSIFKRVDNENINMYYEAIIQGDDSLKTNMNSTQGIVYGLFKGLKATCKETVHSLISLKSRMDTLMGRDTVSSVKREKEKKDKVFIDVENISLSRLEDNSKIEIKYEILGEGNIFTGVFRLHHLRKGYELINERDKNNFFIFDKPIPLEGLIEVGGEYNLIYNSVSRTNERITVKILELKMNSIEKVSEFDDCSAVDELIKLIYKVRYGD